MKRRGWFLLSIVMLLVVFVGPGPAQGADGGTIYLPLVIRGFGAPQLKWAYGGCYSSWCETGWYSSPAAVDVNGDGINDVVASAYSIWALNGLNGSLLWRKGNTNNRTWPGVVVADINKDGQKEIVIAQSGPSVSVYRLNGTPIFEKKAVSGSSNEFRGLLAADLDANNSTMEIVVTSASGSAKNTWVLNSAGNPVGGKWPQMTDGTGYAWGVYNANAAAGDLRPDLPGLELVVPSDVHYINAYDKNGNSLAASATDYPGKTWGQVGVWENLAVEKRGWGACDGVRAESYRTNFADGPAVIADVNGDGTREVVVTGNMYDCHAGYPPSRYIAPFIFNADRSRFNTGGYNWQQNPVDTGAPISEDYNVIESAEANPVVADLDGDGKKEILFASYDGRVHAFWLDRTEHGSWPYSVYKPSEGFFRFASEPLVADLDNNGRAEVIFTSWTQETSNRWGRLHILSWDGAPIYELDLPAPKSSSIHWNGGLAAPTLVNVDGDPDLELVVNTAYSGVVVYDLPGTAAARVLWGTGRGSYTRDGYR
ncbi:MAG TPA: VCBS repeat-containing protein [Anaerolineaceae bacterium]|nr:VCBS repeat-containing protein [Anaerolineaceae bacterium]